MKIKPIIDIPDNSEQYVMYQIWSRATPLIYSNDDHSYSSHMDSRDIRVLEKLLPQISSVADAFNYSDIKVVGGIFEGKYNLWYLTSNDIVMPWVEYGTKFNLIWPMHIPPIFFGPGEFFKNFDYTALNTDYGNQVLVHNMNNASSTIYSRKVI